MFSKIKLFFNSIWKKLFGRKQTPFEKYYEGFRDIFSDGADWKSRNIDFSQKRQPLSFEERMKMRMADEKQFPDEELYQWTEEEIAEYEKFVRENSFANKVKVYDYEQRSRAINESKNKNVLNKFLAEMYLKERLKEEEGF